MRKIQILLIILCLILTLVGYYFMADTMKVVDVNGDVVVFTSLSSKNKRYGIMATSGEVFYHPKFTEYYHAGDYLVLVTGSQKGGYNVMLVEKNNPKTVVKTFHNTTYVKDRFKDYLIFHSNDMNKDILISTSTGEQIEVNEAFDYTYSDISYIQSGNTHYDLFHNGYAVVKTDFYKYGIIDQNGNIIIEPVYTYLSNFNSKGKSVACKFEGCGIINTEGTVEINFLYTKSAMTDELRDRQSYIESSIENQNGLYGVINQETGEVVIPFENEEIIKSLYYRVKKGNSYGLYNLNGVKLLEPIYDSIDNIYYESYGRTIIAYKDDIIYVFDRNGNELFHCGYDYLTEETNYFDNQVIYSAYQNEKQGFIDHQGNKITEISFDQAFISNGKLQVIKEDILYTVSYPFGSGYFYRYIENEDERFLTLKNEIIYVHQGSIYKQDVNHQQHIIYNKFFAFNQRNIITGSVIIGFDVLLFLLINNWIKNRMKHKQELKEFESKLSKNLESFKIRIDE